MDGWVTTALRRWAERWSWNGEDGSGVGWRAVLCVGDFLHAIIPVELLQADTRVLGIHASPNAEGPLRARRRSTGRRNEVGHIRAIHTHPREPVLLKGVLDDDFVFSRSDSEREERIGDVKLRPESVHPIAHTQFHPSRGLRVPCLEGNAHKYRGRVARFRGVGQDEKARLLRSPMDVAPLSGKQTDTRGIADCARRRALCSLRQGEIPLATGRADESDRGMEQVVLEGGTG